MRRVVLLVFMVLLVIACGGGDDEGSGSSFLVPDEGGDGDESSDDGGFGGDDSSGLSEGSGSESIDTVSFSVDREVWHSGFRVAVGNGGTEVVERLTGDPIVYLTIDAVLENLGPDQNWFPAPVNLVVDGLAAIRAADREELPPVPAGLASAGTFAFLVEADFDPDRAQLVIGFPEDKQAIVPLGASDAELVALPPSDLAVAGSLSLELVDLEFTGGSVRSDVPVNYDEVAPGQLAITLEFDVTSRKSGNWSIFADNFALIGPDGVARSADGSGIQNLPGSDAGVVTAGNYVRFLVDEPADGAYTLRFTPPNAFIGADGVTEATFGFTIG